MSNGLWVGVVTTLAGVALGGAVSFVLARQQMKDARAQAAGGIRTGQGTPQRRPSIRCVRGFPDEGALGYQ